MRPAAILREALLNLATGTTRAALFATALAAVLVLACLADIGSVGLLTTQANRFRDAGGSTLIYQAPRNINGAACDALRTVPGVLAAGAMRTAGQKLTAAALPGQSIPTFDISPGFHGFRALGLGPKPATGPLISHDLATTLGIRAGGMLHTDDGSARVSGIYSYANDGRQPGYGYAALIPTTDTSPYDQCWVETWPQKNSITSLLATTLLPGAVQTGTTGGQPPQLQQLNASLGTTFAGRELFDTRITRYAPWVTLTLAFLLGFISVRRRRLELASARHCGVSPGTQAAQLTIETAAWVLAATAIATSAAITLCARVPGTENMALRILLAGTIPTLIGALTALALTREKLLFAYFSNR